MYSSGKPFNNQNHHLKSIRRGDFATNECELRHDRQMHEKNSLHSSCLNLQFKTNKSALLFSKIEIIQHYAKRERVKGQLCMKKCTHF